jgi:hypothetical protein
MSAALVGSDDGDGVDDHAVFCPRQPFRYISTLPYPPEHMLAGAERDASGVHAVVALELKLA